MKGSNLLRIAAGFSLALAAIGTMPAALGSPAVTFKTLPAYLDGGNGGPGPEETSTVVGDFNGDGIPDIAMCDGLFYGVGFYVLLGNGDGTFRKLPETVVNFEVGTLAVGDFNGDGKADLLALNDGVVYVLLGNGDGTFTQKASYIVPELQQDNVVVNDLNHDGKLDMAILTHAGVYTLLGNGDGTFKYPGLLSTQLVFGGSGLALANLNNDGNADLAASDAITQQIYLLTGNGDGTFTYQSSLSTSFVPGTVLAGDLNGDGIDDIVSSNEADPASSSLQVNLSDGKGGWSKVSTYAGGLGPVSGTLADLNGDGKLDIISSATLSNQEVVLLNNGDGSFGAPLYLSTFPAAGAPQTPVVADFNRDGKPDIAVGGVYLEVAGLTSLAVFLNTGP